jgi:hypothetical protein
MSHIAQTDSKGKPLPFDQQTREYQINDMAITVANFADLDRSGLPLEARIDWYMNHTSVSGKDEATRAEVRALVAEKLAAGIPAVTAPKFKATPVAKSSLKIGDRTVLGPITAIEVSPSGKTMKITTETSTGPFTDRVSAAGNMYLITDEDA